MVNKCNEDESPISMVSGFGSNCVTRALHALLWSPPGRSPIISCQHFFLHPAGNQRNPNQRLQIANFSFCFQRRDEAFFGTLDDFVVTDSRSQHMAWFFIVLAMIAPIVLYCFEGRHVSKDGPVGYLLACYIAEAVVGFVCYLLARG